MNYQPFGDRLIIKNISQAKEEGTSLVIPKSAMMEEKAIGLIVKSNHSELKEGMKVIYEEFEGIPIPNEESLYILDTKYILATII